MANPASKKRYVDPIVAEHLKLLKQPNQLVLDVGCGVAAYGPLIGSENYVGVDVTNADYDMGDRRNPNVVCTALNLPFRDDSFGVVMFVSICMYLNQMDLTMALSQANRVLNDNGRLLVADYSYKILKAEADRGRTKPYVKFCQDWIRAATESGFTGINLIIKPYRTLVSIVNLTPPRVRYYLIDRNPVPILLTAKKERGLRTVEGKPS